jgi:hypothetical protein
MQHRVSGSPRFIEPTLYRGRRGELAFAERRLRRALAVTERQLGAGQLELVRTLATLAAVLRRRGRPAQGKACHRRALRLYDRGGLSASLHAAALLAGLSRDDHSAVALRPRVGDHGVACASNGLRVRRDGERRAQQLPAQRQPRTSCCCASSAAPATPPWGGCWPASR